MKKTNEYEDLASLEKSSLNYCIKIKANAVGFRVYCVAIMFFNVRKGSNGESNIKFTGKPYMMITKYVSDYKSVRIEDDWKKFDDLIRKNFKNTLNNYFSLYNKIYKKIISDYFHVSVEDFKKVFYEMKRNHGNLAELFSDLEENIKKFFLQVWQMFDLSASEKGEVLIDIQEIHEKSQDVIDHDLSEIDDNLLGDGDNNSKSSKKASVDWGLDKNDPINNFSAVVSINVGALVRDLNIGDHILVTKPGSEDSSNPFSLSGKTRLRAKIIQKIIDDNNHVRFLILLDDNSFGDVEIDDDLIKIRTDSDDNSTVTEKAKSESLYSQASLILFNVIVAVIVLIAILYFLFK